MHTTSYNFFDLKTLHVHAENISMFDEVDKLFGNFRNSEGKALPSDEEHVYFEEINGQEDKYLVTWNNDTSNARTLNSNVFSLNFMVNQHILANLPFLFVHASVVSRGSDVLVFMGDSGYGKTTLCLALVSQGFKYLSDEYAVIDLAEGKILPYPRCGLVSLTSLRLLQELHEAFIPFYDVLSKGGVSGALLEQKSFVETDPFEQERETFINPWLISPESQERRCTYKKMSLFMISPGFRDEADISPAPQVEAVNSVFCHAKNLSSICKIGQKTVIDSVFQLVEKTNCFYLKQGKPVDTVKLVRKALETPSIVPSDPNSNLLLQLVNMRLNGAEGRI